MFQSSSPSTRRLLVLPVVLVVLAVCGFITANTGKAANPGTATGAVSAIGPWQSTLTIQLHARRMPVISALVHTADAVTRGDFPYVWAGGHAAAGVASTGGVKPRGGRHPKQPPVGFDCSGAVAAVLAGAGLWTPGSPVPGDADLVKALLRARLIARGVGRGANEVTLFDKPGIHVFMRLGGRFWGTSDGLHGNSSQPHGGAGWLNDGAPDAHSRAFKPYYFLARVLTRATSHGPSLTFVIPSSRYGLLDGLSIGERVSVSYRTASDGTLSARSVAASH
jgi:hypothetical protein